MTRDDAERAACTCGAAETDHSHKADCPWRAVESLPLMPAGASYTVRAYPVGWDGAAVDISLMTEVSPMTQDRGEGATAAADRMRAALQRAVQQFLIYESHHRAKGTPESDAKAEVNREMARVCLEAADDPSGDSRPAAAAATFQWVTAAVTFQWVIEYLRAAADSGDGTVHVTSQLLDELTSFHKAALRQERNREDLIRALIEARGELVIGIAFIGRDLGTDRLTSTLNGLVERFVAADEKAMAALRGAGVLG